MFYVYVLKSLKSEKFYIGSTVNIERRLEGHNRGKTTSTRNKGPCVIVYHESFQTRGMAVTREKQLKSYKGGNAFKQLTDGYCAPPRRGGWQF